MQDSGVNLQHENMKIFALNLGGKYLLVRCKMVKIYSCKNSTPLGYVWRRRFPTRCQLPVHIRLRWWPQAPSSMEYRSPIWILCRWPEYQGYPSFHLSLWWCSWVAYWLRNRSALCFRYYHVIYWHLWESKESRFVERYAKYLNIG